MIRPLSPRLGHRWLRSTQFSGLFGLLCMCGLCPCQQLHPSREPAAQPEDAVPAILQAFDQYPLVALGEFHRNQQEHDFVLSLVRARGFPDQVNDIVVEFGASRYQDLADRYIRGDPVRLDQLQRVWRDTVNILVWDAPVYQRLFETVRQVNQSLPPAKRLRVLLGDPSFDWSRVQTRQQWEQVVAQRDPHAAEVITNEVLAKGHRALIIYGMGHVERFKPEPGRLPNLITLLERDHPGKVFAIWPYTAGWGYTSKMDKRLGIWPNPSLARLTGNWPGSVSETPGTPTLAELADALLYFGPLASQTESRPPDDIYRDPLFLQELLRRDRIQGGFNRDELKRLSARLRKRK